MAFTGLRQGQELLDFLLFFSIFYLTLKRFSSLRYLCTYLCTLVMLKEAKTHLHCKPPRQPYDVSISAL